MKKYTVIYTETIRRATMRFSLTHAVRVETDDIAKFIDQEEYNGNVNMIFEGWPAMEGEGTAAAHTKLKEVSISFSAATPITVVA